MQKWQVIVKATAIKASVVSNVVGVSRTAQTTKPTKKRASFTCLFIKLADETQNRTLGLIEGHTVIEITIATTAPSKRFKNLL